MSNGDSLFRIGMIYFSDLEKNLWRKKKKEKKVTHTQSANIKKNASSSKNLPTQKMFSTYRKKIKGMKTNKQTNKQTLNVPNK